LLAPLILYVVEKTQKKEANNENKVSKKERFSKRERSFHWGRCSQG
jgi:hypothetical protein